MAGLISLMFSQMIFHSWFGSFILKKEEQVRFQVWGFTKEDLHRFVFSKLVHSSDLYAENESLRY